MHLLAPSWILTPLWTSSSPPPPAHFHCATTGPNYSGIGTPRSSAKLYAQHFNSAIHRESQLIGSPGAPGDPPRKPPRAASKAPNPPRVGVAASCRPVNGHPSGRSDRRRSDNHDHIRIRAPDTPTSAGDPDDAGRNAAEKTTKSPRVTDRSRMVTQCRKDRPAR